MFARRALPFLSVLALSSGCAGRTRDSEAPKPARPHVLRGELAFESEFEHYAEGSEIPRGHAPLRKVRVCLIEQHGSNDLRTVSHLEDDALIGCDDTDGAGKFELRIPRQHCKERGDCSARYYLATDLCVWHEGAPEVCVTANTQQGKRVRDHAWQEYVEFRKFMWSRTYRISLTDRESNVVSWNLSCPGEDGEGRRRRSCDRRHLGGWWDRDHSNMGYNKETVHMLAAGAAPVNKFGTMRPRKETASNPGGRVCGTKADRHQKGWTCTDAIRLVLKDMRKLRMDGKRVCGKRSRSRTPNSAFAMRLVCIGHPYNPFAPTHEMGHIVHLRWLNYQGPPNGGKVTWRQGLAQKSHTGEGWADFFATASWWPRDAKGPRASGWQMEDSKVLEKTCRRGGEPIGEWGAAHFFWDLWDLPNPAEPNDDVSVGLYTMLKVWSLFEGKQQGSERRNRSKAECDPHGRNLKDYVHYWMQMPGEHLADPRPLLLLNCQEGAIDGTRCE